MIERKTPNEIFEGIMEGEIIYNSIWLRADDVKKFLENEKFHELHNVNSKDYLIALDFIYNVLCNSQEQEKFKDNPRTPKSDIADVQGRASVSCEHNTGEESTKEQISRDAFNGKSSPVQNPKYDGWKKAVFSSGVWHYFKDNKIICNSNATFSTMLPRKDCNTFKCRKCVELLNKSVQKKCTCKEPVDDWDNNDKHICVRCGGKL